MPNYTYANNPYIAEAPDIPGSAPGGGGGLGSYTPAITAGIGGLASLFGSYKQAQSQKEALNAQLGANREAMQHAQAQESAKARTARARWGDYTKRLELFYRNNPNAVQRYGYRPGFRDEWLKPAAGPGGAPGQAAGVPGGGPVTLAGGRQVSGEDYDAYVRAREARRAGMPAAGGSTLGEITDPRRGIMT